MLLKGAMARAWVALMKAGRTDEADQIAEDMFNMTQQEQMSLPAGGAGEVPEETPPEEVMQGAGI